MSFVINLIVQRIALGFLLLFFASILIFVGTQILPGDVAQALLGQSATPESLANLRESLGLDQPAITRYLTWASNFIHGDLGTALSNGERIAEAMSSRLSNTLFLAFCTAMIAVPLAIFLGLLAVRFRDRWPDKLISAVTLTSISIPEFALGYILMYFLSVKFQVFLPNAVFNPEMGFFEKLYAAALPIMTLTFAILAHMMRMTRAAILNVMQSAYIETAELKGISGFSTIRKHALPNAISPIINVVMLNLAYLIVGVIAVEVVFSYNGLGRYLVDHVSKRDMPVVQACGLLFATIYIGLNVLADVLSILSNPRLRHPK